MTPLFWYLLMVTPAICLYIYGLMKSEEVRNVSLAVLVAILGLAFVFVTGWGIVGIIATAIGAKL